MRLATEPWQAMRKRRLAFAGSNAWFGRHGLADQLDQRLDPRGELQGALGRLQPVRAADEQLLAEQVPQTRRARG